MASRSSASSRLEKQKDTSEDATKPGKIVTYEFDPLNPPPLTPEQKAELAALAARSDDEIDFSDIPPLTEDFWARAQRNPIYRRALKQQLTIRLDADLLAWFKAHAKDGKGYQSDINSALREHIERREKRRG